MLLKIHASFHQDGKTINKANEEKGEVSLDVRMWCYYEELKEKRENIWIEDYGASYEELKHMFMTTTVLVVPEGLVEMVVGVASGSGSMSSPACGHGSCLSHVARAYRLNRHGRAWHDFK